MTQDAPITDLDLLAYADGRLEPARARQVEAALADDPALRAKVEDFARQNAALAAQFDAYAAAPLPDRLAGLLSDDGRTAQAPRPWMRQAAAAAIVALTAGASGWWLGSTSATTDAATDRFLSSAADLHSAQPAAPAPQETAGEGDRPIRWFSERVSLELAVPDLRDRGFVLVRKQRVDLGGAKGVRLRYRAKDGGGFDVFLKSRWQRRGGRVATLRRDGTALAHWLDGPLSVVVAGTPDVGPDIGSIARTLRARIRRTNGGDAPNLSPHGTDAPAQATATRSQDLAPASGSERMLDAPASPDLLQPATEGRR